MILIVDDEAGIRETLRRFLTRRGFEVSTAGSPTEALRMLRRSAPVAMILDIRMPDPTGRMRSGLELLQLVRSLPEFATLPVLALTGHVLSADEEAALRAGRVEVFYKPVGLRRIADHLTAMTGGDLGNAVSSD